MFELVERAIGKDYLACNSWTNARGAVLITFSLFVRVVESSLNWEQFVRNTMRIELRSAQMNLRSSATSFLTRSKGMFMMRARFNGRNLLLLS